MRTIKVSGNDLYFGGTFISSATFGSTLLTTANSSEGFVAKYNTSGVNSWAIKLGTTNVSSVADIGFMNNTNTLFIGGNFTGNFGSLTSSGSNDIFLTQLLKSDGSIINRSKYGGANDETMTNFIIQNNNIFLCGNFTGTTTTFGSHTANGNLSGANTWFLAKINPNFTKVNWIKTFICESLNFSSPSATYGYSVFGNGTNEIFMYGKYELAQMGGGASCIKCLTTGDLCTTYNNYSSGAYAILRYVE